MDKCEGRIAAAVWSGALWLALAGGAHAQVVISQVYGGGGNSGATLRNDFIELRNTGAAPVSLDGWSVQYASSAGTSWSNRTQLAGTIAPGGYYLIQQAAGSGGSADLPTPDAVGSIAMAGGAGKVALVRSTAALSGACPLGDANLVDFVGYGSAANCFEGSAPTATLGNTTAALRKSDGASDSNDNAADFAVGAPNPRNSGAAGPAPEPALPLAIARIQGGGLRSPYEGKRVVTEGVVTARKFNNGFFLQSEGDGDPATSDAIFVFTGSAPPAAAAVGHRVRVTARVEEFVPSSNRNQLSVTELVEPTVELLHAGAALPAPVELGAAELGPDAAPDALERLEAMRVSVAAATAVAPSGGSIRDASATAANDGVFHVVLPGVARPFREPGIGVLDAALAALPPDKRPPLFDTNPERLMVRSWGQIDAQPLTVDVGAQVRGLRGVLDYHSGTWALLPDPATPPAVAGGRLPQPVSEPAYDEVTVAGFNLLRLFDEVADNNGAPTVQPQALAFRLAKAAAAICDYLKAPDILGVVEVENLRVLGLLSERVDAACGARAPHYQPYLVPGNDVGGINVGFLVARRDNGAGRPRVDALEVVQYGKDATLANPDGSTSLLNDRPPLLLRARVHQDNGAQYPVTVIVNHLRSLNDLDSADPGENGWSSAGARVRAKRGAQAAYLAGLVESLQQADPSEKIILVGDFNAFEFNDGYVDVLGVIKGEPAPPGRVLSHVPSPLARPLIDGSQLIADPAQRYSYVYAGNAQALDHVLVNEALFLDAAAVRVEHARINADFAVDHFDDPALPLRVSDHDPVRLSIAVPAFRSADLAVAAGATPRSVRAGQTATFAAAVRNAGPNPAEHAAVAFAFDAAVTPAVTAPAGWTCAAPAQDAASTTVTCTTPRLAPQGAAEFALAVAAPALAHGAALRMAAAVRSQTRDPANGDNQAEAAVTVVQSAALSVRIEGGLLPVRKGAIATFLVPVRNAGPDAAQQARLVLEGNVAGRFAAVSAPRGWRCARADTGAGFRAECAREAALAPGTQWFAFAVTVPERPRRGAELEFAAQIGAATPDPDAGDNRDTIRVGIRKR
ncbi:lamin tail domain-containing protein [Vulcaniibacterium tengchongense]|uniref:LTD domain-containing protein n=1 Tax=Vulcaniibacterium tengchongense TaxID=1273429 RepID=A0A3N4VRF6_9GAMM|nr:lamin tail domain-containing protein [Vulcaniibacterium tengchongense]RPE79647.1 hypothetical protein EDC50_1470 [Vulcaniibacterium tengchongense]